jgi:hypothetical protein
MFVAFMSLQILLCDEVLPCFFFLRAEVVRSLNLNLDKKRFEFIKDFKNKKLTLSGLRGKGLTQPNQI